MSRVAVTGASGFLGEHLCRALSGAGHEVLGLCREPTAGLASLAGAGVRVRPLDLLGDSEDGLREALAGCDAVCHLAGLVSRDPERGQQMMRLHVDGTRRLFEAAARAGVRRVLLSSTSGTIAVSREPEPVPDETFPYAVDLCAGWPYYLSKIYQEKLASQLSSRLGLEVVVVNPSLLLGPGDLRGSSTLDVRRFLCGQVPFVPPGGLSFADVRDVADACVAALLRGRAGERYLLGSVNWTFGEFFGRLSRVAKVEGPTLRLPARWNRGVARLAGAIEGFYRHRGHDAPVERISVEMSQCYWYCDAGKAIRELGFAPRDPAETLDDTVRDLRGRGGVG